MPLKEWISSTLSKKSSINSNLQVYKCEFCGFEHWDFREYQKHFELVHKTMIMREVKKIRSKHFRLVKI
jgi:hypothetical protein